jgi:pyrimidine operon attenuation protein/uracil phosphoribosyltransferase
MNLNKIESSLKVYLDSVESAALYDDFKVVGELGYEYTWAGQFIIDNLAESVDKQHGFEVSMSTVAIKEFLKDLTYKLSRECKVSRVTKILIDNLTYFLMVDNQKGKFYNV